MTEHDKPQFAALMTGVAELYNKKISTVLLNIYWKTLSRFEFEDVQRAIELHVNDPDTGQFMAKPADIVRYLEGSKEEKALHALSKVESAVRHIGHYTSVAFDDPIIHAVIRDMGGWAKFCTCKEESYGFQSSQFLKRYQYYLKYGMTNYPGFLPSIFDKNCKKALLLGNKEKALEVMQKGENNKK